MLFTQFMVCVATMLSLAAAVPASMAARKTSPMDKRWDGGDRFWQHSEWHPDFIDFARRQTAADAEGKCDLSKAQMPASPTPLPAPSKGLFLSHVAVGRGTQNYTCDLSNSTAAPVAQGALASLYNVSCVAADNPTLLDKLPVISLDLPVPSSQDKTSAAYTDLSGHHFFADATTPVFDLDTVLHQYGAGAFKKLNATPAPAGAYPGQYGKGDGAVPWLKLGAKNAANQIMREVYRVNTAGGNPPKTCAGAQAEFTVEYAAEYWIYSV